jgi:hypothetical protein
VECGHPHVIGPQRGVDRQGSDHRPDQIGRVPQPLVVAGLVRQIAKQMSQVGVGIAHPAGLRGEPEQRLHHRQRDQLGIAKPRHNTDLRSPRRPLRMLFQQVIGSDVECGREGVKIVRHTMIMDTLASCLQSPLGIDHLDE